MFDKERRNIYSNGNGQENHCFPETYLPHTVTFKQKANSLKHLCITIRIRISKVTCVIEETGNYYSNSTQKLGSNIQWVPVIRNTSGLEYFAPIKRLFQICEVAGKGLKGIQYVRKTEVKLSVY